MAGTSDAVFLRACRWFQTSGTWVQGQIPSPALAAPLAGHFADRRGPEPVTRLGAVLVIVSFAGFAAAPQNLGLLIAGTLLFDLGVQAALIAHQSIIYGLEPAARSRLNAVLIGSMFVGMSAGSAIGSLALAQAGWRGLACVGLICGVGALLVRVWPQGRG